MIIVDQLRVSDNGNQLLIDVHVNKADAFKNFYLDKIIIKTADNISEIASELFEEDYIYKKVFEGNQTEAHLALNPNDQGFTPTAPNNFSKDLFFVLFVCKRDGELDPCYSCIPCELDSLTTISAVFDDTLLYQKVMGYTKELAKGCVEPSRDFVDFILLWNAFKASIITEHWNSAIRFYNMLFANKKEFNVKRCGCHG